MRNILIGIIMGIAVSVPSVALAGYIELPWTNNIYHVPRMERDDNGSVTPTVSVFDNQDDKCYVLKSHEGVAMSCVKESK